MFDKSIEEKFRRVPVEVKIDFVCQIKSGCSQHIDASVEQQTKHSK